MTSRFVVRSKKTEKRRTSLPDTFFKPEIVHQEAIRVPQIEKPHPSLVRCKGKQLAK